jgi:hypothetical protein
MQVFGIPSAVGAVAAVAGAAALNPNVGMALGALTAGVGSLLAGYYITAGFDKKLVKLLQEEAIEQERALADDEIQQAIIQAEPHLQQRLHRIVHHHAAIEAEFEGEHDEVEAILASSRGDITALRDRAVSLVKLHRRLRDIIASSDGKGLMADIQRMETRLKHTPEGSVHDALQTAKESTERTHGQWRQAIEKQQQIDAVLTVIETNLQEFSLAMELRKADAAMSSKAAGPEVNELQARLAAAGQACDELVGRKTSTRRRRRRVK